MNLVIYILREVLMLRQRLLDQEVSYQNSLDSMNADYKESRDQIAQILLFKIDSLKKENEILGIFKSRFMTRSLIQKKLLFY